MVKQEIERENDFLRRFRYSHRDLSVNENIAKKIILILYEIIV